jgi:hypothetical protein
MVIYTIDMRKRVYQQLKTPPVRTSAQQAGTFQITKSGQL